MTESSTTIDGVLLRRARRDDAPTLHAIAARTWDGRDYLPAVIEPWLDETTGEFIVAEIDGTVVGAIKVSRLGTSQWWLEACRVDPSARGLGLGAALTRYGVARGCELQAAEGGFGAMGALVDEGNVPSLRILTAAGFEERVRFTRCVAACEPGDGASEFRRLDSADATLAIDVVHRSDLVAVAAGARDHRPVGVVLDDPQLLALAESGQLYGWSASGGDPSRLDGLVALGDSIVVGDGSRQLAVSYLDAPGAVTPMAAAVRSLGASLGADTVEHQLQASPERVGSMLRARWRRPAGLNLSVLFTRGVGDGQLA